MKLTLVHNIIFWLSCFAYSCHTLDEINIITAALHGIYKNKFNKEGEGTKNYGRANSLYAFVGDLGFTRPHKIWRIRLWKFSHFPKGQSLGRARVESGNS